ncbi:response regulator [Methylobacterium sp. Leaf108]|uniref:hybrid sensor histidine kinase/response regulator n=1 Tax=Methylobacterium sp. Leaf108 TaxID=1736256 RepID=UPI0006FD40B3|nr:response regulator [Methylobacterium sp. Leaf108]KQP58816.1 response regulator receiver protein [Methylobacterium sp. Leaf108]
MDIRQQLLEAFAIEYREHVDVIRAALAAGAEARAPDWNDIFRRAHSLKGASRAVDLPAVEAVAHRLETLFERIVEGSAALDRAAHAAVDLALDRIEACVADLQRGLTPSPPQDALAALDRCLAGPGETDRAGPAPPPARAEPAAETPLPSAPEPAGESGPTVLRVPADAVEALTRAAHELGTALIGEGSVAEGLARIRSGALELGRRAERFRSAADGAGRQPAAVDAKALDAALAEMRVLEAGLLGLARDATSLSRQRSVVASAVEAAASRVRDETERLALVPAEAAFGGFARVLRDMARDAGADVDVSATGLDLPVDRAMLQALKDPVLHALRNALSHGAEPAPVRARLGKPPAMAIGLDVAVRGGRLMVTVVDDGRGPDLGAIAETARRRGLLAGASDPETLLAVVFEPGFSTSTGVDTLSGRGIGLSVVADTVRRLDGTVRLQPRDPWGTALVMSLPLQAARRSLLLVEAGSATYALPSRSIERLLRIERGSVSSVMGRSVLTLAAEAAPQADEAGLTVPVAHLADLVGGAPQSRQAAEPGAMNAVLLRDGQRRCVLEADRLLDVRTLLVMPAPPVTGDRRLVVGTVIVDGSRPVLVLDPDEVVGRAAESRAAAAPALSQRGTIASARRSTILVVDDSITTRTLEKGILEAAGYRVVVCVDGQDALDRLRAAIEPVDLVVADVEMPRLDGFGLLEALRAEPAFARLPIVLMTSRGDPDDVARGLALGADAYLTKQGFDQGRLLDTIGQLL